MSLSFYFIVFTNVNLLQKIKNNIILRLFLFLIGLFFLNFEVNIYILSLFISLILFYKLIFYKDQRLILLLNIIFIISFWTIIYYLLFNFHQLLLEFSPFLILSFLDYFLDELDFIDNYFINDKVHLHDHINEQIKIKNIPIINLSLTTQDVQADSHSHSLKVAAELPTEIKEIPNTIRELKRVNNYYLTLLHDFEINPKVISSERFEITCNKMKREIYNIFKDNELGPNYPKEYLKWLTMSDLINIDQFNVLKNMIEGGKLKEFYLNCPLPFNYLGQLESYVIINGKVYINESQAIDFMTLEQINNKILNKDFIIIKEDNNFLLKSNHNSKIFFSQQHSLWAIYAKFLDMYGLRPFTAQAGYSLPSWEALAKDTLEKNHEGDKDLSELYSQEWSSVKKDLESNYNRELILKLLKSRAQREGYAIDLYNFQKELKGIKYIFYLSESDLKEIKGEAFISKSCVDKHNINNILPIAKNPDLSQHVDKLDYLKLVNCKSSLDKSAHDLINFRSPLYLTPANEITIELLIASLFLQFHWMWDEYLFLEKVKIGMEYNSSNTILSKLKLYTNYSLDQIEEGRECYIKFRIRQIEHFHSRLYYGKLNLEDHIQNMFNIELVNEEFYENYLYIQTELLETVWLIKSIYTDLNLNNSLEGLIKYKSEDNRLDYFNEKYDDYRERFFKEGAAVKDSYLLRKEFFFNRFRRNSLEYMIYWYDYNKFIYTEKLNLSDTKFNKINFKKSKEW